MSVKIVGERLIIDTAPVREAFGYEPKYKLEDALRDYRKAIMENPHLYKPFDWGV